MSKKEKTTKKKVEEKERVPKHVSIRLSYRDYMKLVEIGDVAARMKEDRETKKIITSVINGFSEDLNADKFLGLVAGLHAKERTLERFYSQAPRGPPARMYFTDPEKCSKAVTELYEATKKWTKDKLRYDQKKETCPTDVRVMFYAYVRGKELVEDGSPDITVDKFLKKIAPNTLSKVKHIKRNNGSLIWEICSEIRGIKKKSEEPKKGRKKIVETEEESEEESEDDEPPKRRGKKIVESSEDELSEEESEEEAPKKNKSKRR